MRRGAEREDIEAIEAVIRRQFASLDWSPGKTADWDTFASDFASDAVLYPSARPAKRQTVQAFIARMQELARTTLRSFREAALGTKVLVFGNVALATAACEMTENEAEARRGVEMLLLVKDAGSWRIVAQGWDNETATSPIPSELLGNGLASAALTEESRT